MKAVLDASALVEYLLPTGRSGRVRDVVEEPGGDLYVPAVCDAEVTSALRRLALRGTISLEIAHDVLADYVDLRIERVAQGPLLARVLDLRHNFGAFDAMYAALAESLDASLLTADGKLARAVREHLAVTVIEA